MPLLCLCRWYANEAIRFGSAYGVLLHRGRKIMHWTAPLCCTRCVLFVSVVHIPPCVQLCFWKEKTCCLHTHVHGVVVSDWVCTQFLTTQSGFYFQIGRSLTADHLVRFLGFFFNGIYYEIFPDLNQAMQHKHNFSLYFSTPSRIYKLYIINNISLFNKWIITCNNAE